MIAGLMFVLFALNITPRQWLHDKITGHTHSITFNDDNDHLQTSKSSFKCNWENQVAESPFEDQSGFQLPQPVSSFFNYAVRFSPALHTIELHYFSLRGPPAQA